MNKTQFADIYNQAVNAGKAAMQAACPRPMIVGTPTTPLGNDIDFSKPVEIVMGGVCGFAWVNVKAGNSAFARWLVKQGLARKDSYYGGVTVWVFEGGQSMELKQAYAYAMAAVLHANAGTLGIKSAYAGSRMD